MDRLEQAQSAARGEGLVEEMMPELIRGLAQNHIHDGIPGQSRGILDLLEEDQSRDQRLREHRMRRSQNRERVQSVQAVQRSGARSRVHSYHPDPIQQQLQEMLNEELNRQIQEYINQEIQRQIQEQLQMYIDQEMEQQIMQQMMSVSSVLRE